MYAYGIRSSKIIKTYRIYEICPFFVDSFKQKLITRAMVFSGSNGADQDFSEPTNKKIKSLRSCP